MSPPPRSPCPPSATLPFDNSTIRPSERKSIPIWPNSVFGTLVMTTRGLGSSPGRFWATALPVTASVKAAAILKVDLVFTVGSGRGCIKGFRGHRARVLAHEGSASGGVVLIYHEHGIRASERRVKPSIIRFIYGMNINFRR